jgi:phage-related minor tail protein
VIPFAQGGIVPGPMMFPMRGASMGLMGEAGPEAIMPLRRGRGGRLGVDASQSAPRIVITVSADSEWVRATARDESGKVVAASAPTIERNAVETARRQVVPTIETHRAERGGDYRGG